MSTKKNQPLPPDWVQRKLAELRAVLRSGEWPEGGDRLLLELQQEPPPESAQEISDMLSLVVNDALEGVDIRWRYPTFYRLLLADPALRDQFLVALDLLEATEADQLDRLPYTPSRDLSFLNEKPAGRPPEQTSAPPFRAMWRLAHDLLHQLFNPLPTSAALRRQPELLEDEFTSLLEATQPFGPLELQVFLQAVQPADDVSVLSLNLYAAAVDESGEEAEVGGLQATVTWGSYRETATLDSSGEALFPPLPVRAVTGEGGEIREDLQLVIDPASS